MKALHRRIGCLILGWTLLVPAVASAQWQVMNGGNALKNGRVDTVGPVSATERWRAPHNSPFGMPVFVDGAVTKGPVAGARVCGVWTVAGVADASTQTCADTGSDGKYALQMPRRTGLLVVTATGGSYRDEATGATVSMGTLRSATAFDGVGNNVTAQVSAVTEVLVRRAQARGPLDETTVAAATAEVRRTFGVSDPLRTRPADVTTRDANVAGTSELLYGLSNAGVVGWMAERGIASLDEGLAALSAKIASGTLYDELAAYRAGIKRVIVSNPASGLNLNASAYSTMVSLDFGTPPPAPNRATTSSRS